MQIEYIARIGLASRRAAQQKRHLAIGDSLLGEIVVDDQRVQRVVAEIFAHRATGERRQKLHRRRIGRGRRDNDRIGQRALFFQYFHELRDGRAFLPDRDINAIELEVFVAALVQRLLIEDGIERQRGLAGLAVADDQFALAAPDRDQGVDRLEAGRHRLVHGFARNDARRLDIDAGALFRMNRALAIDRIPQRVDDAAEQPFANRNIDNCAVPFDRLAFLDVAVGTENDNADVVAFKVQGHAAHAVLELDHFAGLDVVEAIDAGDTIPDREDLAYLGHLCFIAEVRDLVLEDRGNFRGADLHQPASFMRLRIELSLVLRELSTMREPSLTIRPPMSAGSTLTAMSTSPPEISVSAFRNASTCS